MPIYAYTSPKLRSWALLTNSKDDFAHLVGTRGSERVRVQTSAINEAESILRSAAAYHARRAPGSI